MEGLPSHLFQPEHRENNQFTFCREQRKYPNSFSAAAGSAQNTMHLRSNPQLVFIKKHGTPGEKESSSQYRSV
jgi:hypothetical protein